MTADTWHRIREAFGTAAELGEEELASYLASIPQELRAEVSSLLAAHRNAGGFMAADAWAIGAGAKIGPYRVLDKVGEGGMGAVYLARREAEGFQQIVALKVIPGMLASGEMNRRFLEERRILASLAHANIVRLLDAGEWEGGHYFAMEKVDGVPITEYCRGLALKDRLQLFGTVCSAIHYAHQNLIVHRDIKAGNILVTANGEVKVLDFGIAKLLDSAVPTAATKFHPMSLDCASPEQVKGGSITTATDIYSLGVLLYELLTGVSPQGGSGRPLDETVRRICELTPERPSSLARDAGPDLDSIVMRAMQKDPGLRYASAEELSRDVARYLAGAPVLAREATWRYVAQRFVARNKLAVAAAAAGTLMVAGGVGFALWEGRIAARERARAERRFDETRKLARSVIFDLQGQLAGVPGTLPVRQKMIEQTLAYLESMARDAGDNTPLVVEIAGSYARVGEIQGAIGAANLGDRTGATRSWEIALRLLQGVFARDSGVSHSRNVEALTLAAKVHGSLGALLFFTGKVPDATAHFEQGVALARRCREVDAGGAASAETLGAALLARATGLQGHARIPAFEEALAVYEPILKSHPDSMEVMRNVARCAKYLAAELLEEENYARGLEYSLRARALDEARLARFPEDRRIMVDLTNDLGDLGQLQSYLHQQTEAVTTLRRNLDLRRRLAAEDTGNAMLQERVAVSHRSLAMILQAGGDHREARAEYRQALSMYQALEAAAPASPILLHSIANCQLGMAQIAERLGLQTVACGYFRETLATLRRIDAQRFNDQGPLQDATAGVERCDGAK